MNRVCDLLSRIPIAAGVSVGLVSLACNSSSDAHGSLPTTPPAAVSVEIASVVDGRPFWVFRGDDCFSPTADIRINGLPADQSAAVQPVVRIYSTDSSGHPLDLLGSFTNLAQVEIPRGVNSAVVSFELCDLFKVAGCNDPEISVEYIVNVRGSYVGSAIYSTGIEYGPRNEFCSP